MYVQRSRTYETPSNITFTPGHAFLAHGSSDGSIGLVKIIQRLKSLEPTSTFGEEYSAEMVFEVQEYRPFEPDNRGITALVWVEPLFRSVSKKPVCISQARFDDGSLQPILVHCKPGMVHLWSLATAGSPWSGSRSFTLRTQRFSVGSSSLCPASGINYLRREDALLVTLSDGSFHVIDKLSTGPSMGPWGPDAILTSERLSGISRSVFTQAEHGNIENTDVNNIRGQSCYDNFGTIIWVHEYDLITFYPIS
jgi:general transcription factor 3C protein 4